LVSFAAIVIDEARQIAANIAKLPETNLGRVEARQALGTVFHMEIVSEALPKTVTAITSSSFRFRQLLLPDFKPAVRRSFQGQT
jgi:hypothetical protein